MHTDQSDAKRALSSNALRRNTQNQYVDLSMPASNVYVACISVPD